MRYRIIEHTQGSPQWKSWRRNKIGASDAPTIMGENPWKTPYQLYQEKVDGVVVASNAAMERGTALEPLARKLINQDFVANFQPVCMESVEYPFIIASLDGWDNNIGLKVLEIKCPGAITHGKIAAGEVPEHYKAQLQHQMFVADVGVCLFASFDGQDYVKIVVTRDDNYVAKLIAKEIAFYECLQTHTPPELCDRDYVRVDNAEAILLQKRYLHLKQQIELLEAEEKLIKKSLIDHAGEKNAMIGNLRLTKYVRKGAVDYDKIEVLKAVDLEAYRKKSIEVWVVNEASTEKGSG